MAPARGGKSKSRANQSKEKKNHANSSNWRKTNHHHHHHHHHPKPSSSQAQLVDALNFVPQAGPGCHIARREDSSASSSWVLGWEDVDPSEFQDNLLVSEVPDLAVDPDERTLTLCNVSNHEPRVAYITIYDRKLQGKNGIVLEEGQTTDEQGRTRSCTTLIVLCPPKTFCHLCYILNKDDDDDDDDNDGPLDLDKLQLESDVQPWSRHENIQDEFTDYALPAFPLQGNKSDDDAQAQAQAQAFLCTQGEGGYLTHFFAGNQHAIDFRCPKGTPLVAVANGQVVEVSDRHANLSGIAVSNLFSWNSILLKLDHTTTTNNNNTSDHQQSEKDPKETQTTNDNETSDNIQIQGNATNDKTNNHMNSKEESNSNHEVHDGDGGGGGGGGSDGGKGGSLFVEYVHIATSAVQPGDRVTQGQVIGTSGGIGFSPEDHLHFAAYRSSDPHAPTVRVRFQKRRGETTNNNGDGNSSSSQHEDTFLPRAGRWYNAQGEQPCPASNNNKNTTTTKTL